MPIGKVEVRGRSLKPSFWPPKDFTNRLAMELPFVEWSATLAAIENHAPLFKQVCMVSAMQPGCSWSTERARKAVYTAAMKGRAFMRA